MPMQSFMRQPVQRIAHDNYNIGLRISDPAPIHDSLDSVVMEEDESFKLESDITTTELAQILVDPPKSRLSNYNLQNYTWLEQYLSDKEDSIKLPNENKTSPTYKLKTTTDTMDDLKDTPCTNTFGGGSGVCKYLTECEDLSEAFKDLSTYLKYSCDANGYAGVCCKAKVR